MKALQLALAILLVGAIPLGIAFAIPAAHGGSSKPIAPHIRCGKVDTIPPYIVTPKCHVYEGSSK